MIAPFAVPSQEVVEQIIASKQAAAERKAVESEKHRNTRHRQQQEYEAALDVNGKQQEKANLQNGGAPHFT